MVDIWRFVVYLGIAVLGFVSAEETNIPVEMPEVIRAGAECHVMSTLTLHVDLKLLEKSTNQIVPYSQDILIPEGKAVPGKCTPTTQDIYYFTQDGFLEINMKFNLEKEDGEDAWNLDQFAILVLQPNVSNPVTKEEQFAKRDQMLRQGTMLLRAPINMTFQCTKVKGAVYSSNIHSAMIFSQVQLQPYSEYVQLSADKGYICPRRRPHGVRSRSGSGEYLVPIILATSLGIVMLLLLIGYLVLKRIGKLGYQNME